MSDDILAPENGNPILFVDMMGLGCECCGCFLCSYETPPTIDVTLTHVIDGRCGDCDDLMNTTHELTYNGGSKSPSLDSITEEGCCHWVKFIDTECDVPFSRFYTNPVTGNPAYRLEFYLCLINCVDLEDGTTDCQTQYTIELRSDTDTNIPPDIWWGSLTDINFATVHKYRLDCCAGRAVGPVFHDGGPDCYGDWGWGITPGGAPFCNQNQQDDCFQTEPFCHTLAFKQAITEAGESTFEMQGEIPRFSKAEASGLPTKVSVGRKMANFGAAYIRWAAAGWPKRTPERVQQIYDEHCSKCPFFQNDTCTKCGCPTVRTKNLKNKLLWATESCPLDPPLWKAEV